MKKILYILTILILGVIPFSTWAADDFPSFPMAFYGNVTLDGDDLTSGAKVQAYIGDELMGEIEIVEDGQYGSDNPTKSKLLIGEYASSTSLVFKYVLESSSEALTGISLETYTGEFMSGILIEKNLNFKTKKKSSGGGSGGNNSTNNSSTGDTQEDKSGDTSNDDNNNNQAGDESGKNSESGKKNEEKNEKKFKNLAGLTKDEVEKVSLSEAKKVSGHNDFVKLSEVNVGVYVKLMKNKNSTSDTHRKKIAYFIQEGTSATEWLGSGERAGVVNSFFAAFGKVPENDQDWQDVVKIANGRWPSQRNEEKEAEALTYFEKIYGRQADRNNPHDDAAVVVISYGLRPANRNFDSEKAAIKSFEHIFGKSPESAVEWDIVRAIAYSGAVR